MKQKSDMDRITEEKVQRGGLLARFYFDMQNQDKEKLQPLMLDLVNERLLKEPGVVYCYGYIEEPIEHKDAFTTSAVITLLTENFATLVRIAFNYAPAGIELLKPENSIQFRTSDLQSLLMDVSQISVSYSRYIMERVLKPEDMEKIKADLERRAETGKKHLENKKDKPS